MVILQIIMGFILGIYLMEIVSGHSLTKKILNALKRHDSNYKGEKTTTTRTLLRITWVNG